MELFFSPILKVGDQEDRMTEYILVNKQCSTTRGKGGKIAIPCSKTEEVLLTYEDFVGAFKKRAKTNCGRYVARDYVSDAFKSCHHVMMALQPAHDLRALGGFMFIERKSIGSHTGWYVSLICSAKKEGTNMMNQMEDAAKDRGIQFVFLQAIEAARGFYEKLSYRYFSTKGTEGGSFRYCSEDEAKEKDGDTDNFVWNMVKCFTCESPKSSKQGARRGKTSRSPKSSKQGARREKTSPLPKSSKHGNTHKMKIRSAKRYKDSLR